MLLLLTVLFVFRFVGVALFLYSGNKRALFYFPDFFIFAALLYAAVLVYPNLAPYTAEFLIGLGVLKVAQEYLLHWQSATPAS
jgi:hypothetical protein